MFKIRRAHQCDSTAIAPLIYEAIGDIANNLTNEADPDKIISALASLVEQKTNRHTFENTFVAEKNNEILGIVVLYDGKRGKQLDQLLAQQLGVQIDIEAYDDEYYIDTICVAKKARGQGIGTQLLKFAENQARILNFNKLSLNVEREKIKARMLYNKQGFIVTEPWTIIDEEFHHMVKQL